jgi:hypothetical protein
MWVASMVGGPGSSRLQGIEHGDASLFQNNFASMFYLIFYSYTQQKN